MTPPLPNQRRPHRGRRIALITAGSGFGVLLILWVIGTIIGPQTTPTTTAASTPVTPPAAATTRPAAATQPAPASRPPTTPPATHQPTAAPKPKLATVVAILQADDDYYRNQFADGQDAFDKPAFAPWYQATFGNDRYNTDRIKAEQYVANDTQDQAVIDWLADANQMTSDLNQWAATALTAEPGPETDQMHTLAAKVEADLTTVDADVAKLAAT